MINYDGKVFKPLMNSDNGQVGDDTVFRYSQSGNIVEGTYAGGDILKGTLIAVVDEDGSLDMRYQHVDVNGNLRTGKCLSIPEVMKDGRIRLREQWEWTCDDFSAGQSVIEEI